MKKIILLTALLAGLFFSEKASATHIIGAELTYKCLGGNQYEIILDVYRDCGAGNADFEPNAYVQAFDEDGNFIGLPNLTMAFSKQDTLPNNISNDPCLLPPDSICVSATRYEKTVTFTTPGKITVVYQRCCRNAGMANIENSLVAGSTYFVEITPEARALCNSTPVFNSYPPIFVCAGNQLNHDNSATDPDGDSLVYKFYTPFLGGSPTEPTPQPGDASPPPYDTVVWISPTYSLDAILGPTVPPGNELTINSQTGLITGVPMIQGQFVVGVLVEEYRNGLLMSVVRRDFQYNVGECVQVTSTIVSPEAQCDDLTVNFGNDTDGPPNFQWYFDWPNLSPGSTEIEPTHTYADTGLYTVALIVAPGFECVDTAFQDILIQDNSLIPDFEWQTFDCTEESVLVLTDQSVDNVSPPDTWNWTVQYGGTVLTDTVQNPVFVIPNAPTSGTITLNALSENGCDQTTMQNFVTGGNNPLDSLPAKIDICIGESTELNPLGPTVGFTYEWGFPVPPNQQNLVSPTVMPLETTTYAVTITGYDGLCVSTEGEVTVEVSPTVDLDFMEDTQCDVREVNFVNQSTNAFQGYFWDFGDLTTLTDTSSQSDPTYVYPDTGTYTVMLATAPDAVCEDTIFREITLVEKILEADFSFQYLDCEEDALAIQFFDETNNSLDNTVQWAWTFSGIFNGTSDQPNPVITVLEEGTLNVALTVTTDETCTSATVPQTLNIDFTEIPGLDLDGEPVLGCLNGGVTLNPGGNINYIYQWMPATGLSCATCPSPFANPGETTTYTVLVQNISADTCDIVREVTVFVPDNVNLLAGDDVQTCDEMVTLTATSTLPVTNITWFFDNQIEGLGATLDVTVSGVKDYVVGAADEFECAYFDTVQVAGGPVDIATSGDEIICSNELEGISATNLDPEDILDWFWSPASAINGSVSVADPHVIVTPGEQTLYVTATNQFGCSTTDSVFVAIIDVNNSLAFSSQVGCSGSTVTFTNLSENAFNYFWDFGDPTTDADTSHLENPIYTYSEIGSYTVTLTIDYEGLDCVTPATGIVEIVNPEFTPDFEFEYVECDEDSILVHFFDTSINFLNNTAGWTWTTSDGGFANEQNPTFWIYNEEDFVVTMVIETENGCVDSTTQTLKLDFPVIELADSITLCQGDSVNINPLGNPAYEFLWFPNENISDPTALNPVVWPSATTTYSVQVTTFDTDTCTLMRQVTVFVPEKISVEASDDTLTCGTPVMLSAISNISPTDFVWTNMGGGTVGNGPNLDIYPFFDEVYKVRGEDQYGCADSAFVAVANERIQASLEAPDLACPDVEATLAVDNSVPDHVLNFDWSSTPPGLILPPANTAGVTANTVGAGLSANYEVIVGNQFGCADTLAQNIGAYNFVPTVNLERFACPGVPTELNPGANIGLTFTWSPAADLDNPMAPNPIVTTDVPTVFTVNISDQFGMDECAENFEVNLDVAPVIEFDVVTDTFTCGEPIVLSANTNVSTTFEWLDPDGMVVGTGNTLEVNPDEMEVYTLVATDGTECEASTEVTVFNRQIDLSVDGQGVIDTCPAESYDLCVTNLDPSDILTFQWTGNTVVAGANAECATVETEVGSETIFTVEVENQFGCQAEEMLTVTTYDFAPVIREIVQICPGVPTALNPDAAGSGLEYSWTPITGLSCTDCPNPVATIDTSILYTVVVMGDFGEEACSLMGTVQADVMPQILLTAAADPEAVICETDGEITLSAEVSSPFVESFEWSETDFSNPFSTAQEVVVSPNGAVTYIVTALDTMGCADTANITVSAFPLAVTIPEERNFCEEIGEVTLNVVNLDAAEQNLNYVWSPSEFIVEYNDDSSSVVVDISETTLFTVAFENQYGCDSLHEIPVEYYNIGPTVGEISSTRDTIYFNSGEFSQLEIDFVEGYQYDWSPEDGLDDPFVHDPIATPAETTTYTVTVTDQGGCIAEREITITVLNPDCAEPNLFLPNAFSPNGDGENDVLYFRANVIDEMELSIYNRWGQLVFRTTDQSIGWDGVYNGDQLPPDVFGYYLKAKCFNGMEFFKKGNVTLLR